jgi:hypothetical protein
MEEEADAPENSAAQNSTKADGSGSNRAGEANSRYPQDSEYTPYAKREGLYQRGWENYLSLLTHYWQPYLQGRTTFDDAIAHMVSAL